MVLIRVLMRAQMVINLLVKLVVMTTLMIVTKHVMVTLIIVMKHVLMIILIVMSLAQLEIPATVIQRAQVEIKTLV